MATITLTIGSQTKSKTISPADITRVLDALKAKQGKVPDTSVPPPSVPGPIAMRDRTNTEVFDAVCDDFFNMLKKVVRDRDADLAAAGAQAGVSDVTLT